MALNHPLQLVQIRGAFVLGMRNGSSQVYGVLGLVLGLLAYLHLQAVIVVFCAVVFCAEINVVWARR